MLLGSWSWCLPQKGDCVFTDAGEGSVVAAQQQSIQHCSSMCSITLKRTFLNPLPWSRMFGSYFFLWTRELETIFDAYRITFAVQCTSHPQQHITECLYSFLSQVLRTSSHDYCRLTIYCSAWQNRFAPLSLSLYGQVHSIASQA